MSQSQHTQIHKTEAEWRDVLTPEQYYVTRQHGTEPAFTGKYWHFDGKGVYRCVCCGQELFRSDQKYDSGIGWPSFWAPIEDGRLKLVEDHSLGMERIEVRCGRCGAHLGHLFDDGPRPTGQRYCLNSASLEFDAASAEKAGADVEKAGADAAKSDAVKK
jgi:peptide-methionine (R)-S-oxide reductase